MESKKTEASDPKKTKTKSDSKNRMAALAESFDTQQFKLLHEEMSFSEYLDKCFETPRLVRTAYQRLYDMIMAKGSKKLKRYRRTYTRYEFFNDAQIPIFGLEETLDNLVKFIRGAAGG